jgi:hypothetical protein
MLLCSDAFLVVLAALGVRCPIKGAFSAVGDGGRRPPEHPQPTNRCDPLPLLMSLAGSLCGDVPDSDMDGPDRGCRRRALTSRTPSATEVVLAWSGIRALLSLPQETGRSEPAPRGERKQPGGTPMAITTTYGTLSASEHSANLRKAVITSTIGTTIESSSCTAPPPV